MTTYCRPDRYRGWVPRVRALGALATELDRHAWVRRAKAEVLDLPPLAHEALWVDVPPAVMSRAHKKAVEQVRVLLDRGEDPHEHAFELVSRLRCACGVAKIDAGVEFISEHVRANPLRDGLAPRPLVVWAHHHEVVEAMVSACEGLGVRVDALWGGTAPGDVAAIIDDFQAGRTEVLVASMTSAGVGVTLTASADALFVETDWTPALVEQALDRMRRIGQTRPMRATTLVAAGTLDERIHEILTRKAATVAGVAGGAVEVVKAAGEVEGDLHELVDELVARARGGRRPTRVA